MIFNNKKSAVTPFRRAYVSVQPQNGYLNPKLFNVTQLPTLEDFDSKWSVPSILVGIATVYLYRVVKLHVSPRDVFSISARSAKHLSQTTGDMSYSDSFDLLIEKVSDLSETSISAAIKLSGFNSFYANESKKPDDILVDKVSLEAIKKMVEKIDWFTKRMGKIHRDSHTMEMSSVKSKHIFISEVDRFFLSQEAMWYIKVFRNNDSFSKIDTLLLLIFYLFGLRSHCSLEFKKLKVLGVFDPSSNKLFSIFISDIPKDTIEQVEKEVIGFY